VKNAKSITSNPIPSRNSLEIEKDFILDKFGKKMMTPPEDNFKFNVDKDTY